MGSWGVRLKREAQDPGGGAEHPALLEPAAAFVANQSSPGSVLARPFPGWVTLRPPYPCEHSASPARRSDRPRFGRYEGWSLADIAARDDDYLVWLGRSPVGGPLRAEIAQILDERAAAMESLRPVPVAVRRRRRWGRRQESGTGRSLAPRANSQCCRVSDPRNDVSASDQGHSARRRSAHSHSVAQIALSLFQRPDVAVECHDGLIVSSRWPGTNLALTPSGFCDIGRLGGSA